MLTGFKVSFLERKCIFYRTALTGKWGPHRTEILDFSNAKIKYSNERAQRVDEKNRVICLVLLALRVITIKMSKMSQFMCFLLDIAKYQCQFGQDI